MSDDTVNHPKHYGGHPSGVDCIDVVEHFNFNRGNAIKYIWRAGKKGDELEDLKKARWYVDREIERLERKKREPERPRIFYFYKDTGVPPSAEPKEGDIALKMDGGDAWRYTGGEWAKVAGPAPSLWEKVSLSRFIKERDQDVKDLAELYEKVRREHVDYAPVHPGDLKEGDWVRYRLKSKPDSTFTDALVADGGGLWAAGSRHLIRNVGGGFALGVFDVRQIVKDPR